MRANVLNDAALVKQAGQFAWLSIDSDKPANEGFVAKFASGGVPLFMVIDTAPEDAALSWYGTATAHSATSRTVGGQRTRPERRRDRGRCAADARGCAQRTEEARRSGYVLRAGAEIRRRSLAAPHPHH